jgi:hypothetical protein
MLRVCSSPLHYKLCLIKDYNIDRLFLKHKDMYQRASGWLQVVGSREEKSFQHKRRNSNDVIFKYPGNWKDVYQHGD